MATDINLWAEEIAAKTLGKVKASAAGSTGKRPNTTVGGSLYPCLGVFLVLGLAEDRKFWSGEDTDRTSRKIMNGQDVKTDCAMD